MPAGCIKACHSGVVVLVSMDHRSILVADKKLDHAILPGLEAGGVSKPPAKLRVLARRHRTKHVPGRVELLKDARYPRQCLEGRLQIVGGNQSASDTQLVNRKLHPELRRLVLDNKQYLVVGGGKRL